MLLIRIKMVNSILSYFDNSVLKIQPLTRAHKWFRFLAKAIFSSLETYHNMGLILSSVVLVFLFCLSETRRKALGSCIQIEFETEGQKHILGLWSFTCVFQSPFPFICFKVMFIFVFLESLLSQLHAFHRDGHSLPN